MVMRVGLSDEPGESPPSTQIMYKMHNTYANELDAVNALAKLAKKNQLEGISGSRCMRLIQGCTRSGVIASCNQTT